MRARLSMETHEEKPGSLGNLGTLRELLKYLWPPGETGMKVRVVLALTCLVLAKVALMFVPLFYGRAVDALSPGDVQIAVVLPLGLILGYGAARVLSLMFGELRDAVFAVVGQRAVRTVALQAFQHLHSLSLRYHLERQTGGLSRAIERGTRAIETLLRFSLFNIIPILIEILMVFIILWNALDPVIALISLATVVLYIAYTMYITEWRLSFRREMNLQDSEANTKAIDSLLNYETVKYFGNEDYETRRYDIALQAYEKAAVKSQTSLAILNIGQAFLISLGLTVIMIMTGNSITDGTMKIGGFVMANTYLMQLYQPLGFFGFVYREIKQSLIDIEKMLELMDVEQEVSDSPGASDLNLGGGRVVFDRVSFGYDERRPILKELSFEVQPGKTVAFVGPSGAGKSTLSRLLYRFYDVNEGQIRIDDQDIRSVSQSSVRAAIGIVPQDTVLFNDTIYYNIAYGHPQATPSEVEAAARLAQIHDFIIALPDGYQSMVGERGLKLSGGEKQRVAIARTIIKNPCILIFDEATSALDTHTEQEIQANLRVLSQGRTTLSIAHRLSTIIDSDEIIVLEDGRISERGTHSQLLKSQGPYSVMWQRQQQEQRVEHELEKILVPEQ